MTERRDAPWPLRIPDMERRKKEAVAIARWKGEPSAHALLVGYVVECLDRDLKLMEEGPATGGVLDATKAVKVPNSAGCVIPAAPPSSDVEELRRPLPEASVERIASDVAKRLQRDDVSPNFKKGGK